MSNADEILKLKELLDKQAITQEEYEKMKTELLKGKDESKTVINKYTRTTQKQNNKKNGCLGTGMMTIIIMIII